jgi:dTDP-4-dehydrorhamnose reductase
MRIIVLGVDGMLGHVVFNHFRNQNLNVVGTSRRNHDSKNIYKFDILDANDSLENLLNLDADIIINCIGIIKPKIDVNSFQSFGNTIKVNSVFPHVLSEISMRFSCKVIQIATDCVFDGRTGNYVESSNHNAVDLYGKSKSIGEVVSDRFYNLRTSIIGPEYKTSYSLLEWFRSLPFGAEVSGFSNHNWNGITTLSFAKICQGIIEHSLWNDLSSLQHVVPVNTVTKYQILNEFKIKINRSDITVNDVESNEPIDRTLRTENPDLNNLLWSAAGYSSLPRIDSLINEMML